MHAAYSFLVTVDPKASAAGLREAAISRFEYYIASFGDENNGWEPMALILRDGRVLNLAEEDDWRERDEWAKNFLDEHPNGAERYDAAIRFALGCVVGDLLDFPNIGIGPESDDAKNEKARREGMTDDELVAHTRKAAATMLMESFAQLAKDEKDPDSLGSYRRRKLATMLDHLSECAVTPFSTCIGSPYDYRAFDLRADPTEAPGENCAILVVDIHT